MRSTSALALYLAVPWLVSCSVGAIGGSSSQESDAEGGSDAEIHMDVEEGAPPMSGVLAMPGDPTFDTPSGGSGGASATTSGAGGHTPTCQAGDERSGEACGFNYRGHRLEVCDAGEWSASICSDPDVCYDGSWHPGVTACGDQGVVPMTCAEGAWTNLPGCTEPPVCSCPDEGDCLSDACDPHAMCRLTIADYLCQCGSGYEGDGETCVDIDECAKSPCGVNEVCDNSDGGYSCACAPGYELGTMGCVDRDECLDDPCDPEASCDNMDGYVICTCPLGFSGNGYVCSPN